MTDEPYTCIGNVDQPECDQLPVWVRRTQFAGNHYFCDTHARREKDFDVVDSTGGQYVWERLPQGLGGTVEMQVDKPFSVKDFIDKARAAGHDALGIANDPEAIAALEAAKAKRLHDPVNHHTREPHQPTFAVVVEGELTVDHLDDAKNTEYRVQLDRIGPGQVEFTLTVNGRICGKLPFDNLVKAATRIDPDHATGPEKQIRALRREAADALAKMYDWQARAGQLEEKVHALEAALEAARHARS